MPYADPAKQAEQKRRYYEAHRDEVIARAVAWNKANPTRRVSVRAKWREKNPDYANTWYLANREKVAESCKKNYQRRRENNPELVLAQGRERQARRRALLRHAFVERIDPWVVWHRDEGVCGICGSPADSTDWHLDHIVAISRGGEHSYRNVQVAHPLCNQRKGRVMSQVVTLVDFVPPARHDSKAWTQAQIEEGTTINGPWTLLETIAISPVDADPSHPAARSFTTELASDTPLLWYRIIFLDATGDDTLPTIGIQNGVTSNYATVAELAALLSVSASVRRVQLQRVLDAAAAEINAEIGTADITGTAVPYTGVVPALVAEVNIERATEHWQQMQSPFGLLGVTGESMPAFAASDTWQRHAHKLAPLKGSWGIA